jgi:hypothetical protein
VGSGFCRTIQGDPLASTLLANEANEPVAIWMARGLGGFLLVGFDSKDDSLDGTIRYNLSPTLAEHSLARMLQHFEVKNERLSTNQSTCYKEFLTKGDEEFVVFYSHLPESLPMTCRFRSKRSPTHLLELSSGRKIPVAATRDQWFQADFNLPPQRGYYFLLK